LRYWDPETFEEKRRLLVKDGAHRVDNLNELEYIKGEIYANVWQTDRIARISPKTGLVTAWIDLKGLLTEAERAHGADFLNGIAYDAAGERLFVTGKYWPKLFHIRLKLKN
jgi:glutamine cyclotransferase